MGYLRGRRTVALDVLAQVVHVSRDSRAGLMGAGGFPSMRIVTQTCSTVLNIGMVFEVMRWCCLMCAASCNGAERHIRTGVGQGAIDGMSSVFPAYRTVESH